MINFLMFSGLFLLFIGLPTSIILTIVFAVKKKKKVWIPAIGIHFCFIVSILFLIVGVTMYEETDEYKKYHEEQETKERQEKIEEELEQSEKEAEEEEKRKKEEQEAEEKKKQEEEEKKRKEEEEKQKELEELKKKEEAEKEKQLSEENFKNSCKEFNYNTIARNPEEHIGENYVVTVEVSQAISETSWFSDYDKYYMAWTDDGNGYYYDHMIYLMDYMDEENKVKLLEGDIVKAYGTFKGMVQTENILNDTKGEEIKLDIYYVELISE